MRTLAETQLSEKDRQAVQAAASILRTHFPVERVILFGSKARGDSRADSDIDLLVLTRCTVDDEQRRKMTDALFALELDLGVVISKLVIPVEEWESGLYRVLPIKSIVETEGAAA